MYEKKFDNYLLVALTIRENERTVKTFDSDYPRFIPMMLYKT